MLQPIEDAVQYQGTSKFLENISNFDFPFVRTMFILLMSGFISLRLPCCMIPLFTERLISISYADLIGNGKEALPNKRALD